MLGKIMPLLLIALVAGTVFAALPDIQRYLKLRDM